MTILEHDRAAPADGVDDAIARTDTTTERRAPRWRSPISLRFVLRRLVGAVIAVWGALTIVFVALHLSGNPASLMADPNAGPEEIARLSRVMGYDRPAIVQYLSFFRDVARGDFPDSIRYHTSPVGLVLDRLGSTLLLTTVGLLAGIIIGLSAGYVSAMSRNRVGRTVPLTIMNVWQATPPILLGVLLVLVFSVQRRWLPTGGSGSWKHLVLPATTLAVITAPSIARVFRASILAIRDDDHVRTAIAKGVSPRRVRLRHVAVNALSPVVTVVGLQTGALLGGAVVTESLFSWPGVGQLAINAASSRDFPVVLATVAMAAIAFVLVNFVVDVVASILDPRVRTR